MRVIGRRRGGGVGAGRGDGLRETDGRVLVGVRRKRRREVGDTLESTVLRWKGLRLWRRRVAGGGSEFVFFGHVCLIEELGGYGDD
jgi:hypothetical protein